jgi:hypothetical protein
MVHILAGHFWMSVRDYRATAIYLIAGVVLATVHAPVKHYSPPREHSIQEEAVDPSVPKMPAEQRFQMNFGDPPSPISVSFHIARIVIAGWFAFLGVLWDVRRRMKEWALIRLYGGYPSLVAGFQYLCLALAGVLIGCSFALLIRSPLTSDEAFWLIMLTLAWGAIFSICVSVGPVVYTEFCDVVQIFRIEGEVR